MDLQGITHISSITLWNRSDCCSDRLSNFYIITSAIPFASQDLSTTLNDPNVSYTYVTNPPLNSQNYTIDRTARYIRIQLSGNQTLSLAEVQVFSRVKTLTLAGAVGGIQWESSANNTDWTPIAGARASTYNVLTTTAGTFYYRAVVTGCGAATTATATVTVNPLSVAGTISGPASVSINATTGRTLTLANYTGTIQWQSSTTLAGTYANIAGATSATYDVVTTTAGTKYYRAVVTSGACSSSTSSPYAVTVNLTVTYDSQGGSAISSGTTTSGGSIAASPGTPTRTGYSFNGWFAASSGGSAISFPYTHGQTTNFTLYAQWIPLPTITSFTPSSGNPGTLVTITGTNLGSPTAFTIGGAAAIVISNTGTSLVGMVMPGSTTGTISISTAGGSATSSGTFTVSATPYPSAQQGSKLVGTDATGAARQGTSISLSADGNTAIVGGFADNSNAGAAWVYTRSGSTWTQRGSKLVGTGATGAARQGNSLSLSADGNTAIVGANIDNSNIGASWVYAVSNTITYNGNSNTGGSVPAVTTGVNGASVTLASNSGTLTRTGYTFGGWNILADGTGTSYAAGASYTLSGDVTLYAQWTANTLTVTYDSQSGSAISNGSTTTGGSISASPGTPTRTGYTFNGWFAASSGGSAISFPYTHGQTATFTLYAQWTAKTLTVT